VWVLSAIAGVVIVVLAAPADRPGLLSLALAGAVVLTFGIQLATADRRGFTTRVTVSAVGAFAVLALASLAGLAVP
jgi:hypothetical protein